jgi:hypothetical protein
LQKEKIKASLLGDAVQADSQKQEFKHVGSKKIVSYSISWVYTGYNPMRCSGFLV